MKIERIGPYEIRDFLGRGGMGEVYRAHDARLGRDVAIKILSPVFMLDADRLARFEREARLLASLNHTNVGGIYGLEDVPHAGGSTMRALVLELIDGETLAELIARRTSAHGGVPLSSALDIARQIAAGLDAAHERGIVHRDLKPANIKITSAGVVKILDFGLAKASGLGASGGLAEPTNVTMTGAIVGTPAYMSPEQARGQVTDKRTDIWAFGCVLYELLSGRRAFPGESISETIAAILNDEPDWSALPGTTPASVRALVGRCLARNPRERLRDIGDASFDAVQPVAQPPGVPSAREVQFKRLADFDGMKESPAISPDGKMVVFVSLVGKRRHLFLQRLAGGAPLQITQTDQDHEQPRWAPDSDTLIYYTPPTVPGETGMLYEMSTLGGSARPIAAAAGPADISHGGDRLAFFIDSGSARALMTSSRHGSDLRHVTDGQPWQTTAPRWSPDDRSIAFQTTILSRFDERLCIAPADGDEARTIARAPSIKGFCWLPGGRHLVYSSSAGSTVPYPPTLNLRLAAADGSGDSQATFGDDSYVEPDVHPSGKVVACRIRAASDIWAFPIDGPPASNMRGAIRVTHQTGQVQTPSVSPDGREIVYLSDHGGHGNLWITRADGSGVRQLTFERDPGVSIGVPGWSPTANRIVFVFSRAGHPDLWLVHADGRGLRQLVSGAVAACWSRDGEWIYYVPSADAPTWCPEKISVDTGERVIVSDDGASHAPVVGAEAIYHGRRALHDGVWQWEICRRPLPWGPAQVIARIVPSRLPVSALFIQSALSPDGRWLAIPLIDGATSDIWLIPTDGSAPMHPVTDFEHRSTLIARQVSWSPDGRLVYAAVAESTTDVILLDGLLNRASP